MERQFTRLFTVDEANATLAELRPLLEDLLGAFREVRAEIEATARASGAAPGSADFARRLEERGRAGALFARIRAGIERIQSRGVLVNGPEAGLIDFPCLYAGEIVFLCWKHGEAGVTHWHRIPDGFAGRRPLLDASPAGDAPVH